MKEIRLAKKIIKTLVKDRMQYPARLFADTASIVARCGILILLYSYVFGLNNGEVNGVTFPMVAWSMFFYFAFITLSLSRIARSIMEDITTGNIEVLLSKPISYLLYRAWWQVGAGVYPFVVTTIIGALALVATVGIPQTMKIPIFLPTLFLTFVGAAIVTLFVYVIVGLLAFWIEDVLPVFWIVDKAVMILGGSYLPVALFPDFMYKIALYSPFGASVFVTHTVYESWAVIWYKLIGIQMAWILVLGLVIYLMFSRAVKNVSVNGG